MGLDARSLSSEATGATVWQGLLKGHTAGHGASSHPRHRDSTGPLVAHPVGPSSKRGTSATEVRARPVEAHWVAPSAGGVAGDVHGDFHHPLRVDERDVQDVAAAPTRR